MGDKMSEQLSHTPPLITYRIVITSSISNQAQAILDLQLRRLAALERKKIEEEYAEKKKLIAYLEDLIAHPKKILGVIRAELLDLKARYADPRRTQIIQREKRDLTTRELVTEEDVIIVASASGKLRTFSVAALPAIAKELADEIPVAIAQGNTRDDMLVCTDDGQGYTLPMHRLPAGDRADWTSLADLCTLSKAGSIVGLKCLAAGEDGTWPGFIVLATRQGKVKRLASEDLRGLRGGGTVVGLDEGDQVVSAFHTIGDQQVIICTATGQGIRFSEEEVRPMGLPAGGVMSMKLAEKDSVVGALPAFPDGQLALVTRLGYGKRIALTAFPAQKRYGAGVVICKVAAKSGPVAAAALVSGSETLLARTAVGRIIPLPGSEMPVMGRGTLGRVVLKLRKAEEVQGILPLVAAPGAPAPQPRRARKAAQEGKQAAERKAPARKSLRPPAAHSRRRSSARRAASVAPLYCRLLSGFRRCGSSGAHARAKAAASTASLGASGARRRAIASTTRPERKSQAAWTRR